VPTFDSGLGTLDILVRNSGGRASEVPLQLGLLLANQLGLLVLGRDRRRRVAAVVGAGRAVDILGGASDRLGRHFGRQASIAQRYGGGDLWRRGRHNYTRNRHLIYSIFIIIILNLEAPRRCT